MAWLAMGGDENSPSTKMEDAALFSGWGGGRSTAGVCYINGPMV